MKDLRENEYGCREIQGDSLEKYDRNYALNPNPQTPDPNHHQALIYSFKLDKAWFF